MIKSEQLGKQEFDKENSMIISHDYPVCEYDTSREPIIKPADFLEKCLPEKCVITFFKKTLLLLLYI